MPEGVPEGVPEGWLGFPSGYERFVDPFLCHIAVYSSTLWIVFTSSQSNCDEVIARK